MSKSQSHEEAPLKNDEFDIETVLQCTLTGSEFNDRKAALQNELFAHIIRMTEDKTGITLHFDDNDQLLVRLMEYIAEEKKCCSFMHFELSILPFQNGFSLRISGMDGVKEYVKTVMLTR